MSIIDVVSSAFLLIGAGFALLAGIGLQRFDDVFSRMHAATKAVTFGIGFVCIGAILQMDGGPDITKLVLVIVFQFATAPVAAHMVSRAVQRAGTEMADSTIVDELAQARRPAAEQAADPRPNQTR
ncbi:MAG: monovalent cation/H(+) antiporter subunit G [Actinobacteria bacterium]|nr:monovalent cation/H(+) antiporter subunit G [Actinomycetota bacterium]MCB9390385.1 monovalent cation/H(+) antiporter subunit G [Acidimicrobiia bacterium]